MRRVDFVPGATTAGDVITIPVPLPGIAAVVAATITRLPLTLGSGDHTAANTLNCFGNHTQAEVVACFDDHTLLNVVAAFADHAMADVAAGVGNHTQAEVVATIADHADHAHDLLVAVGIVAEAYGATGAGNADLGSVTGQTIAGGSAVNGGVQENAAAQGHTVSATDLTHVAGVNVDHVAGANVPHVGVADLAHVAGAALAHGAAADPVVAAVPTISTARAITLSVDTVLGDLLTLVYKEVGELVPIS